MARYERNEVPSMIGDDDIPNLSPIGHPITMRSTYDFGVIEGSFQARQFDSDWIPNYAPIFYPKVKAGHTPLRGIGNRA